MADERALLTCYNDPLAAGMATQLPDDERLVIGGFLRVALDLDGMPPLPIPSDADHEWWTTDAVAHLQDHWHHIPERSTSFESTIASNAALVGLVLTVVRTA